MELTKWIPGSVVLISTFLLQAHNIQFWVVHAGAGSTLGWAWSFAIEGAALWLWYHGKARLLALAASSVMIAGPLFVLASPVVDRLVQTEVNAVQLEVLGHEMASHQAALDTFLENSTTRIGWSGRIDSELEWLDRARTRRDELLRSSTTDIRDIALTGLQALALLVVLLSQILAVSSLRGPKQGNAITMSLTQRCDTESEASRTSVSEPSVTAETAETLRKHMQNNGVSQREAAMQMGVRPADVSMLLNHAERLETGRETISKPALQKIEKGLISKWLYIPQSS